MQFFIHLFNLLLYRPLFNILVLLYQYLPGKDFGIAIIFLTLLIKILLYPLGAKAIKIQKAFQELQPKIKEVQEKYKTDPKKQASEMMELYKKEKVNPFSGILVSIIQIPILIGLWLVFTRGLQPEKLDDIYGFISRPPSIDPTFLGMLNLARPSAVLAVFAGLSQFLQTKMMSPRPKNGDKQNQKTSDFSKIMEKQMLYFFPIFTVFILLKLPAAVGLYWLTSALFSAAQQYFLLKKHA